MNVLPRAGIIATVRFASRGPIRAPRDRYFYPLRRVSFGGEDRANIFKYDLSYDANTLRFNRENSFLEDEPLLFKTASRRFILSIHIYLTQLKDTTRG